MLGFLKPRGELVEISGRTVVFLSAKPYKLEQKFEIKLGLPEPPGQTITVAVRVVSCRSGPAELFVVVGVAEGRREPPALKGYAIRNYPRALHRISVKSEGLPGYRAVTKDLGRGGFGAELDGELPEGKLLNLHFEFDEPLGWTLELKGVVAWSTWKSQNRYDTGFSFLEGPQYALALEQLEAWIEHRAKHELVPFKPPDRLPPRRPKELVNQLPQADSAALAEAQKAASGISSFDDDPTPLGLPSLGLPSLVQPPPRPVSLKLPPTVPLERPSAFKLQQPEAVANPNLVETRALSDVVTPVPFTMPSGSGPSLLPPSVSAGQPSPVQLEEDPGVRIQFEASLRGWAWEAADDSVSLVLEDVHGTDHWLEFPGCRGIQARCRQREIHLIGIAVAHTSTMITELSRHSSEQPLLHFRFYDDHQRTVLDLVAAECREQIR